MVLANWMANFTLNIQNKTSGQQFIRFPSRYPSKKKILA